MPSNDGAESRSFSTPPAQIIVVTLGVIAFLYAARAVAMPVFLACIAGMTLKPLVRWLSLCHLPKSFSAAIVLCLLMAGIGFGFVRLGSPAVEWVNNAPQHMTELRQRVQRFFPAVDRIGPAAAAVNNLGATEEEKREEQRKSPTVEIKNPSGTSSLLNWTGTLLVGLGETLVLLYLLLASGDLFTQKLVHVMPTLSDKKRAVEISREVEHSISKYLFSVSLINVILGVIAGVGFQLMGVPNAALWGTMVALVNYVPYFGPILGGILLSAVGLLTFDTLGSALLPSLWYLLLHLLEANLVTPILLGHRFALNPVVIFVSLIFWTWLWGVPGALMSVPILVSIKVMCDRLPRLSAVSELLRS
jgi:predicted PurR-regulated permease PerM